MKTFREFFEERNGYKIDRYIPEYMSIASYNITVGATIADYMDYANTSETPDTASNDHIKTTAGNLLVSVMSNSADVTAFNVSQYDDEFVYEIRVKKNERFNI